MEENLIGQRIGMLTVIRVILCQDLAQNKVRRFRSS